MRKLAFVLAATLLAGLGAIAPPTAPGVYAATNPKVAIIVGATHGTTPQYRANADQIYAEAIKYTTNVVRVYSPNATWARVKAAINGASIIVYLGHGNGWPSPYGNDAAYTTKDGFGLNYDVNGDGKLSDYENKYYGETSIATLTPAPNAVVLLFHLCYASGNSEPGAAAPTLATARQRVDNYGAAFLKAGARAVIAIGHSHDPYYIRALFNTNQTIYDYWRNAPDAHGHFIGYTSARSPGYLYRMDPDSAAPSGFYRSLVGKLTLTTQEVTGDAYASTDGDPSTFVVPGNASPAADGAPVYADAARAATALAPAATLLASDKVRIDAQEAGKAADSSAIFRVHTDGGVVGWMTASTLKPRDSRAPNLWAVDSGAGTFSPNGDGSQDTFPLTLTLSETASWTLRVLDGGGATLASVSGAGRTPTMTWSPRAGSVSDGTYTWSLTASDPWGNGPLERTGPIVVDTHAPTASVTGVATATVPMFTPNGDGLTDTIGFAVGSDEPGVVIGTAVDQSGAVSGTFTVAVGTTSGTLNWDGRTAAGGYAADGTYTIRIAARDRAGNVGAAQTRKIALYGSLGFVRTSRAIFFPQDGDALTPTTSFSFALKSPATVSWTIINSAGTTVRTIKAHEALAAGTYTFAWNGRNDLGAYVPRGTYRSLVTATDGTLAASQQVPVVADAFRTVFSDTTPARGQKVVVTVTSAEGLSTTPKLRVAQPGLASWTVTMTKVSTGIYRASITFKRGAAGLVSFWVSASDSNHVLQGSYLRLPLH